MTPGGVQGLGVVFSLMMGTAAGLLSLLTWEILKRSPFGRGVLVLSGAMVLFIIYHALILIFPPADIVIELVKSGLYTGIAIFIVLLIVNERRIKRVVDTQGRR